jgi:hypothetical protein
MTPPVFPVARAGDVQATPSSGTDYPNATSPTATGSWAAGTISLTTVSVAQSDSKDIVTTASCQFVFTGTNSQSGATFTSSPSTVTLTSVVRKLQVNSSYPLVNGDQATDSFGNRLSVSSIAKWQTA